MDLLEDSTFGHELLNFMDAFSEYNQIHMDDAVWLKKCQGHLLKACQQDVPRSNRSKCGSIC
jgi:hypothetical protein